MASYVFGKIPGSKEGDTFTNRKALREAGIHLALIASIDGNPREGASSIVLNEGYVNDNGIGANHIVLGYWE